jgi:hypothetical protein
MGRSLPLQAPRVLAAAAALVGVASIGGCGGDPPGSVRSIGASAAPAASRSGLPSVPSAVPQADPVAATLGVTATVTGKDLFGRKSTTLEVTLSKPQMVPETKHPNGTVIKPKRGVFAVYPLVIVCVEGTYSFNPLSLYFLPREQLSGWQRKPFGNSGRTDAPEPIDQLDSVGVRSMSAGDRLSGTLVFDQPAASFESTVIVLAPLLLVEGRAAAYWPAV